MISNESIPAPSSEARLSWVEPEMRQLAVKETEFQPETGADGQISNPDCTRS